MYFWERCKYLRVARDFHQSGIELDEVVMSFFSFSGCVLTTMVIFHLRQADYLTFGGKLGDGWTMRLMGIGYFVVVGKG